MTSISTLSIHPYSLSSSFLRDPILADLCCTLRIKGTQTMVQFKHTDVKRELHQQKQNSRSKNLLEGANVKRAIQTWFSPIPPPSHLPTNGFPLRKVSASLLGITHGQTLLNFGLLHNTHTQTCRPTEKITTISLYHTG